MGVQASWPQRNVRALTPYLTPFRYHQEQHRRYLSATFLVMDVLAHLSPVALLSH
jgi:hypothetical protein